MRALLLVVIVLSLVGCGGASSGGGLHGTLYDPPQAAPSFTLDDQDRERVSMADQKGRVVLVSFLYTQCPDVCPLIASTLSDAVRQLGPDKDRVRVLGISVDPRGDTPERVRSFIRKRHLVEQFRYLTGTQSELEPVWKGFFVGVYPDLEDTIAHSSFQLLVDRQGQVRARYDTRTPSADIVHDLRALIDEG